MRSFFGSTLLLALLSFVVVGFPQVAMAQRAVLYEEDPDDNYGKRFDGSVIWRTETESSGLGQSPEPTIKADILIPARNLAATWSLRRNTDKTLPASHVVEIEFKLPADSPPGRVSNVPGLLMKAAEQSRGVALAGRSAKDRDGSFLIGLSIGDEQRNLELLKERGWIDIPMVYGTGRRAILAVEKGAAGTHVFDEVLAAWGKTQPPQQRKTPAGPPKALAVTSVGTGFALNISGHILTSAHVVPNCVAITVRTSGNTPTPARIVARQEADDLAVLKADAKVAATATLRVNPSPRSGAVTSAMREAYGRFTPIRTCSNETP
jgi:S1-C subfamily serine protease